MSNITLSSPPPGISLADYTAIEDAVMETARGRWFLLEFARRQRAGEMLRLTESIDRLEAMMRVPAVRADMPVAPETDVTAPVPSRCADIDGTRAEVAERLMEIAWNMRERGFDDSLCHAIEVQAVMAQSFSGSDAVLVEQSWLAQPGSEQNIPHSVPALPVEMREEPQNDNRDYAVVADNADAGSEAGFLVRKTTLEQRIAALSRLDELPLIEKLALFC